MIGKLIKLRLKGLISGLASKNKKGEFVKPSRAKVIAFAILYIYVALFFAAMSAMMIWGIGSVLVRAGLAAHYFGTVSALAFAVIFIFSIFETKAELFDCKDNELVLSMPIKPGHIVISRILLVLIYNYVIGALFYIPSAIVYAIYSSWEIKGLIGSLLIGTVTPLLATALASAVGYAVAALSKRMKNKTLATMIISLIFIALYFWGYSKLLSSSGAEDLAGMIVAVTKNVGFVASLGRATLLEPVYTAVYMLVCISLSAVAYFIISKFYLTIITGAHSVARGAYKEKSLKRSSSFIALCKKELSKFFSSATYMLNLGIGLLIALAAGIFLLVKKEMLVTVAVTFTYMYPELNMDLLLAVCAALLVTFIFSTSPISSPAL